MKVWALSVMSLLGTASAAQAAEPGARDDDTSTATAQRYHVAPSFGVTTAMGEVAPTVGVRGAWGFGEVFAMGLSATAFEFEEGHRGEQSLVYVGPSFSWSLRRSQRVHPVFEVVAGYGRYGRNGGSETAMAFEGAAGIEIDAAKFMRVGLAGVARFGMISARHSLVDDSLSGAGARLSLSLGRF